LEKSAYMTQQVLLSFFCAVLVAFKVKVGKSAYMTQQVSTQN
jgi:hypothetical protein